MTSHNANEVWADKALSLIRRSAELLDVVDNARCTQCRGYRRTGRRCDNDDCFARELHDFLVAERPL